MSVSKDTGRSNLLWIADLQDCEIGPKMKWTKVIDDWGVYWSEITNDGSLFYCASQPFHQDISAPDEPQSTTFFSLHERRRLAQLQDRHLRPRAPRKGSFSLTFSKSSLTSL